MSSQVKVPEDNREFHLEEYKQLRSEVLSLLGRIELIFRSAIIGAAAIFSWMVSNSLGVGADISRVCLKLPPQLLLLGWLIAPIFVMCAGWMAFTISKRVKEIGGYLRELELALGCPSLGWEAYLKHKPSILEPMTKRLWWLLLALTILATAIALCIINNASGLCPPPKA